MVDSQIYNRRTILKCAATGMLGLLVAACSGTGASRNQTTETPLSAKDYSSRFAGYTAQDEPNVDPAKVIWPAFITNAAPEVKQLYEFQLTHGDLMRYIPCFCGCGNDGHANNRDCYIKQVNPDGSVVFDTMAPT